MIFFCRLCIGMHRQFKERGSATVSTTTTTAAAGLILLHTFRIGWRQRSRSRLIHNPRDLAYQLPKDRCLSFKFGGRWWGRFFHDIG